MKKQLILSALAALTLSIGMSHAQTADDETKKTINSIKKSSQYIYAEATAATAQEAKDLAEEMLYSEINTWVASKKKATAGKNIVINNKKDIWTGVELPRGNMVRSFVYVKKKDIITADNTEVIENTNPAPATTESGISSTVQTVYPAAVMQVAACTQYKDMTELLKQLKAEGKVSNYARYASLDNPDYYYLAIYNTAGKVVAVLSPGSKRKNVSTGADDSVANYQGHGAIGFRVAQ